MAVDRQYMEGMQPGSSGWWLRKLGAVLDARRRRHMAERTMADYEALYRGDHPLLFASARFREVFGGLFAEFADNFCGVVVDSVVERLEVQGFRYAAGEDGEIGKQAAAHAWRVWQANNMDAESVKGFRESFVKGEVNVIVGPGADPRIPEVTVEDPMQTVVVTTGRRRVVAMKRWFDDENDRLNATLYYDDRVEKYQSQQAAGWFSSSVDEWIKMVTWIPRQVAGEPWPLPHSMGRVPMVPIVNQPDLLGRGESELKSVAPLQGAINKLVLDMMVAAEFSAFRQRWITGIDLPRDPETGEEVAPFRPGADSIWTAPPAKSGEQPTQFGDFEQTDLEPYTKAVEMLIQHVATEKRIPVHYLLSTNVMPNAESQTAAEAGLVAKAGAKQLDLSDPLEEVNTLVFRQIGEPEWAALIDGETVWKDREHRTESQHVDAVAKMSALGVPQEALWEKLGASPQTIERWKSMQAEEAARIGSAFDPFRPPQPQGIDRTPFVLGGDGTVARDAP